MKRLIAARATFSKTIVLPPPTLTLPTEGRGGAALPTQAPTQQNRRVPSPRLGGLGWGALEKQTAP